MPPALKYLPTEQRESAHAELSSRREAHNAAWGAYEGRPKRTLSTRPGEPDDNTLINLLRQAVDRLVSFIAPRLPGLELDDQHDTDTERWLRRAWEESGGARLLARMVKYGCLDGHVFARIMPGTPYPRLIALNPANVIVHWQADDYEQVLWYELHWTAAGQDFRQDVVNQGDHWLIRDLRKDQPPGGAGWSVTDEQVWRFATPPILDWGHDFSPDRYYGVGETGGMALNERVNRIAGDISRILRFHAAPRTIGIGFEAEAVVGTGIDNFWTIPEKEAEVFNLEMKTDLASSMNFLNFCARSFMADRRVILLEGTMADLRHVTNLGIRSLYLDQLARAEELRRNYEPGIKAISRGLLVLGGKNTGAAPFHLKINWPDPLPIGELEVLEGLERERALGILSRESAARLRGRDWALEKARIYSEGGLRDESEPESESTHRSDGGRLGGKANTARSA